MVQGSMAICRHRALGLVAVGVLAMALGGLVYLTDRDASRSMLVPAVAALAGRGGFGVIGQWLPSFVHPLAFSLFSAAVLPAAAVWRQGICCAWGAMGVAFEIGQHPLVSARLADALQQGLGDAAPVRALSRYFVAGTFDVGDLVATVFGAVAAAALLRWQPNDRENDDGT